MSNQTRLPKLLIKHLKNNGNGGLFLPDDNRGAFAKALFDFYVYGREIENEQFRKIVGNKNVFPAAEFLQCKNDDGNTALHLAIAAADINAALLIEAGKATPELLFTKNNYGETALHLAIIYGCKATAALLIDAGKDKPELLFAKDKDGETALHLAIEKGYVATAALLIDAGKERLDLLLAQNKAGCTALDLIEAKRGEEKKGWAGVKKALEPLPMPSLESILKRTVPAPTAAAATPADAIEERRHPDARGFP